MMGVKIREENRRFGKAPIPVDGIGVQADFMLGANRSMEGKELKERQTRERPSSHGGR